MALSEFNGVGNKLKDWQSEEIKYYRGLPFSNYLISIIAFIGIVSICMPWADVTIGFYSDAMAVGLHFFLGWLCFLSFSSIISLLLFNRYLKIHEKYIELVPLIASIISILLSLAFTIWHLFHVHFGVYLTFVSALFIVIIFFYFKRYQK